MNRNFFLSISVFITVLYAGNSAWSQVFIESYPAGKATDPVIHISGTENLSNTISADKITGSPFWKDKWEPAFLYGVNAMDKWFCKARLNLNTGEAHFLDKNDQELVANTAIHLIIFYKDNDTSTVDAVFIYSDYYPDLLQGKEKLKNYLQVLNQGKYELLKLYKRTVATGDSMFSTLKRYYFVTQTKYFIAGAQKTVAVKKLNKENILILLPGSSTLTGWIDENKIDLRKEENAVKFLNYYNSKNK